MKTTNPLIVILHPPRCRPTRVIRKSCRVTCCSDSEPEWSQDLPNSISKPQNGLQLLDRLCESLRRGLPGESETPSEPGISLNPEVGLRITRLYAYYPSVREGCAGALDVVVDDDSVFIPVSKFPCLHLARAELLVLQSVFDMKPFVQFSLRDQLNLFRNACSWSEQDFTSHAKYHTAAPAAYLLWEALPPRPKNFTGHWLVWTGNMKRFLKNHLNRRSRNGAQGPGRLDTTSLKLVVGMLQGVKRGTAVVSDQFVNAALADHRAILTAPPKKDTREINDWFGSREFDENHVTLRERLHNFVSSVDLLPGHRFKWEELTPSTSACWNYRRTDGGAYGAVLNRFSMQRGILESTDPFGRPVTCGSYVPPSGTFGTHQRNLLIKHSTRYFCTCTEPIPEGQCDRCDILNIQRVMEGKKEKKCKCRRVLEFCLDCIWSDVRVRLPCDVIPICEPLKVRVITKTSGVHQWITKPLQQHIKSTLDEFPQFVLTNRPLSVIDLVTLEERTSRYFGSDADQPDWWWVSGDFKGATDRLNINLSREILWTLCRAFGLPPYLERVAGSVLLEQDLRYPRKSGVPDGVQMNGQLMGSNLSFPILCIANLLCYWKAVDRYNRFMAEHKGIPYVEINDVRALPVLINGDDIVFKADRLLYHIWQEEIAFAGFVLSIGKNYFHPTFVTVNSTSYVRREHGFVKIPYLNVGLIIGQSKLGFCPEDLPIWDVHNKILDSPDPLQASKHFIHYHLDKIRHCTHNGLLNLFISRPLGGLGFESPEGLDFRITKYQQQLASHRMRVYLDAPLGDRPGRLGQWFQWCGDGEDSDITFTAQNLEVFLGGEFRQRTTGTYGLGLGLSRFTEVHFERVSHALNPQSKGWSSQTLLRGVKYLPAFGPQPKWVPHLPAAEVVPFEMMEPTGTASGVYRSLSSKDRKIPLCVCYDISTIKRFSAMYPLSRCVEITLNPLQGHCLNLGSHLQLLNSGGTKFPLSCQQC
jgi:hypothetical protein